MEKFKKGISKKYRRKLSLKKISFSFILQKP
jgi:hypothetical protein